MDSEWFKIFLYVGVPVLALLVGYGAVKGSHRLYDHVQHRPYVPIPAASAVWVTEAAALVIEREDAEIVPLVGPPA